MGMFMGMLMGMLMVQKTFINGVKKKTVYNCTIKHSYKLMV